MNAVSRAWENARTNPSKKHLPLCIVVREKPKLSGKNAGNFVRYELNKITKKSFHLVMENILSSVQLLSTADGHEIANTLASTSGPAAQFAVQVILLLRKKIRPWFCGNLLEVPNVSKCSMCFAIQLANCGFIHETDIFDILRRSPFPIQEAKAIRAPIRHKILQDIPIREYLTTRGDNLGPSVEKFAIINFLDTKIN